MRAFSIVTAACLLLIPTSAGTAEAAPVLESWGCEPFIVVAGETLACNFVLQETAFCPTTTHISYRGPDGRESNPGTYAGFSGGSSDLTVRFDIHLDTLYGDWLILEYRVGGHPCATPDVEPEYHVLVSEEHAFTVAPGDLDADGVLDSTDNCPSIANADQADLDDDGVGDVCDPDMDGDGLSNADETAWPCLDPRSAEDGGALGDADEDGLTNGDEMTHGTDPCDEDSDGDGQGDGYEVAHGSDPARANSFVLPYGTVWENPTPLPVPLPEW